MPVPAPGMPATISVVTSVDDAELDEDDSADVVVILDDFRLAVRR